ETRAGHGTAEAPPPGGDRGRGAPAREPPRGGGAGSAGAAGSTAASSAPASMTPPRRTVPVMATLHAGCRPRLSDGTVALFACGEQPDADLSYGFAGIRNIWGRMGQNLRDGDRMGQPAGARPGWCHGAPRAPG